jgi:REP element-mobilizing transposase RayT
VLILPRARRLKSETGIYHVVLRGINRQTIFEDDEDREMFLVTVEQYKKQSGFKLLAFCLMGNHVHLLMKTENESLGQIFKRIGVSYVYWYNRKYDRFGHLFQDRFKSEAVETDDYLFGVLRYIHQNPLKAGMVKKLDDYIWSSYSEYIGLSEEHYVDKKFVLSLFHRDLEQAVADFKVFNEMVSDKVFLDISDKKRISDQHAIYLLKKKYAINSSTDIQGFDPADRDKCIRFLLKRGLSARQISRVTGISRYFVEKQV